MDLILCLFQFQTMKKKKNYEIILQKIYQLKPLEIIHDKKILEAINKKDLDLLYCMMVNFHFSFYYDKSYFNIKEYKEIKKWYLSASKKIDFIKNNELIKNTFLFFLNIEPKNPVYDEYNTFTYDQLLCLLISARFVLGTIISEKKKIFFIIY